MHPEALLALATELLRDVLRFDAPADGVVSAFFRRHRHLGPRERHTLAETTYAVLRERLLLQHLATEKRPGSRDESGQDPRGRGGRGAPVGGGLERRLALLAWQGSPAFLRGAIGEHEQQWLDRVRAIDRSTLPAKLRHNLPDWLAGALQEQVGEEDFWPLVRALNETAPLDLRVNALQAQREAVQAELLAAGITSELTPFSPWGLRVPGKPAINRLEAFTRGALEVQDEGSQLLALLTGASRSEMVVDFCAGAGGKTLALGAMMRNTGRLYAFDTSGHRLDALKPRLARSGLSNVYPAQIAHERDERIKRLAGKVDRVLVDAPCSGLGTLRRNPDLKWRQSAATVQSLQGQQQAILESAARLLRSGGRLVYATCSLLRAENEVVVDAFNEARGREFEPLPVAELLEAARVEPAQDLADGPHLRLWPHRHRTDGFFAAVWRRR